MRKDEFQSLFTELVNTLKVSTQDLAKWLKVSPDTISKWYEQKSTPHILGRESVIKVLYAEQQRQERVRQIKQVIKDSLKIEIVASKSNPDIKVVLSLDDEEFYTEFVSKEELVE